MLLFNDIGTPGSKRLQLEAFVAYLRRSAITTWARDRSRPITVNVSMKTSEANLCRSTDS